MFYCYYYYHFYPLSLIGSFYLMLFYFCFCFIVITKCIIGTFLTRSWYCNNKMLSITVMLSFNVTVKKVPVLHLRILRDIISINLSISI